MPERFYAPVSFDPPSVELSGPEARHLKDVLRLGVGREVMLFDGRGMEARAEIASVGKRTVALSILEVRAAASDDRQPVILATAVPKGDRFRFLVEKATELGVDVLVPLSTERSVVVPRDVKLDKMRHTVIAASKQCGRARLMEVDRLRTWKEFLDEDCEGRRILIAHPSGRAASSGLPALDGPSPTIAVIGPEGGLTRDEIDAAVAAGADVVSLGSNILRVETAAIVLCTLLLLSDR